MKNQLKQYKMSAKSTKHIDIHNWIIDVIYSCKTIEHCESTRNLIENYQKKGHNPDESKVQHTLSILDLKSRLGKKIIQINTNGKEFI